MEQLFNDLQHQIAEKMGSGISLTDEDCGQLEALVNGEDQYPVTFPCVLISAPQIEWSSLSGTAQRGQLSIAVRLAFDCYQDTHYGSGQEQYAEQRWRQVALLNSYIHGWKFEGCIRGMMRKTSRQYSMPAGIKVYEMQYETTVIEDFRTVTTDDLVHPADE